MESQLELLHKAFEVVGVAEKEVAWRIPHAWSHGWGQHPSDDEPVMNYFP